MDREEFKIDMTNLQKEEVEDIESIVLDLKDWLENEGKVDGLSVKETSSEPKKDAMGVEWIPVLTALLSAPAVIVLAEAVKDWIKERRKEFTVLIKKPDGTTIEISGKNLRPNNFS